jgi:hypothetical protein
MHFKLHDLIPQVLVGLLQIRGMGLGFRKLQGELFNLRLLVAQLERRLKL